MILVGDYSGGKRRVIIRGGANTVTAKDWSKLKNDRVIQWHLEKDNIIFPDSAENPSEPTGETGGETSGETDSTDNLDTVGYAPLVPTVAQLTPLPGIGTVTATNIISNAPSGGYISPQQLISINSLTIEITLVEVLFEIA